MMHVQETNYPIMLSSSLPEDGMVSQINVFHSAVELTRAWDATPLVTFVVRAPAVWITFFFVARSGSLVEIKLVPHRVQH